MPRSSSIEDAWESHLHFKDLEIENLWMRHKLNEKVPVRELAREIIEGTLEMMKEWETLIRKDRERVELAIIERVINDTVLPKKMENPNPPKSVPRVKI